MTCACGLAEIVQGGMCRRCWAARLGRARRAYQWTPELQAELRRAYGLRKMQRAVALDVLERRTGWPRRAFWDEAIRLGLSRASKRRWTPEEDALLLDRIGEMPVSKIAALLKRNAGSVARRARHLSVSLRIRNGFSVAELAETFGVPAPRVRGWMAHGLLGKPIQAPDGARVRERSVRAFIRQYPAEIDFKLADQTLLKGVLFGQ